MNPKFPKLIPNSSAFNVPLTLDTEADFEDQSFHPSNLISLVKKRWICKYRLNNQYEIAKSERVERLKWFYEKMKIKVKEPNKDELLNLKKLFNLSEVDDNDEDYRLQDEVNDLMLADIEVQDPVDLW